MRITSGDLQIDTMYEARGKRRFIKRIENGRLWYRSGETGLVVECKVWQFLEWVNEK